jgi:hypothetical protein
VARRLGDVLDLLLGEPPREPAVRGAIAVPLAPREILRLRALAEIARGVASQGVACRVVAGGGPELPGGDGLVLRVTPRGASWPEPRALLFVSPDAEDRRLAREAIDAARPGSGIGLVIDGVRSLAEARALAWQVAARRPGVDWLGTLQEGRRLAAALLFGRPAARQDVMSVAKILARGRAAAGSTTASDEPAGLPSVMPSGGP